MTDKTPQEAYKDFETKLAERLFCSAISVQMGISYQHCWKTYIEPGLQEKPVGEVYLEAARFIIANLHNNHRAIFSGSVS